MSISESLLPLPQCAERFGKSVETYKADVVSSWKQQSGSAVCGGVGYGYRVTESSGGLSWRIFWSDGTRTVITKPVKIDWSKRYPF